MMTDPHDTNISRLLLTDGVWEANATKLVRKHFNGGDFIDAGAHVGYYSLLAASMGAKRVYAFEPNPFSFRYLAFNVQLNGFTNVSVYPFALWSETTLLELGTNNLTGNTGNTGVDLIGKNPNELYAVQAYALDDVIDGADFIKVDCEGSDTKVLMGAARILGGNLTLMLESPPSDWLREIGYEIFVDGGSGQGPASFWHKP
jgi:FkbM family methyltransferase